MKLVAVASTVLVVALSAFFLVRFANFRANCVESQLLEDVYFQSTKSSLLLCSQSFWRDPFSTFQSLETIPLSKQWQKIIGQAEKLLAYLPAPKRRFKVVVSGQMPDVYRIHQNVVEVGEKWLERPEAIQRLMVLFWLKKISHEKYYFSHEMVADFLLSVMQNQFSLVGATANLAEDEVTWSNLTVHPSFYCQTPWRLVQEAAKCEIPQNGIALVLRPLLSRALWDIYASLPIREQRDFWPWLVERLTEKKGFLLFPSLNDRHLDPVTRLTEALALLVKQFYSDETTQKNAQVELIAKLKVNEAKHPLVVVHVEPGMRIKAPQAFLMEDQILTWVRQEGRREPLLMAPELPKKRLFIYCKRRVLMNEVMNKASEEILIFKSCAPDKITDWEWAIKGDFLTFVSNHREDPFLWLRSHGLAALAKLRGKQIGKAAVGLKRLRQWSYWLEDSWDRAAAAFRPKAAIDVVFAHRAAKELL